MTRLDARVYEPAVLRRMIATYYTTEDGFKSTLILNNKGPNQIVVTPILHSQNGQTFTASPVAVGGQSSSEVDLNVLASITGPQFRSGSFEFTYEGRLLEIGGGLRIVDSEKSLIFDEQMLEPGMKFPSSQLEAVYAVPFEDSHVSVIVTNTTAQPVTVDGDAVFAGANGHHPVKGHLGPYETKIVTLPHGLVKKASAGAVSLNHNGGRARYWRRFTFRMPVEATLNRSTSLTLEAKPPSGTARVSGLAASTTTRSNQ